MATIKLALLKHTQAKDGTYKIRIAVGHKNTTHYIVTKYKVNSFSEFDNGIVIRLPNAHEINIKLRNLLNEYEERLDAIPNINIYSGKELRDRLKSMHTRSSAITFAQISKQYQNELLEDGRNGYTSMLRNSLRLFTEYNNGDVYLNDIS